MEISSEEKALLQLVDSDIEDSFSVGVTQSGPYLPGLYQYTTIPSDSRTLGRQGILSTFAGLLKRLSFYSPAVTNLTLQSGFTQYGQGFEFASYYKTITGDVVLQGRISRFAPGPNIAFAQLPEGFRPQLALTSPVTVSGVAKHVHITSDGDIICGAPLLVNEWLSLDGIRFRPA